MFLLRCLFWLGLVFSQISQKEGAGSSAFFSPVAAGQTAGLGQMAASAAEDHCRANPTQCLAIAASAAKFMKVGATAHDGDTLTPSDRAPAWRNGKAAKERG